MASGAISEGEITVQVVWEEEELANPKHFTNFVIQRSVADEIVLTLGYVSPPLIFGNPEEQKKQARTVAKSGVKAQAVARVACSLKTAHELFAILGGQLGISLQKAESEVQS